VRGARVGGETVLRQHGDTGNPNWGLARGDAHRQTLSMVVLSGGGAAHGSRLE
jgi:hypothetical protein